MNATTPHAVPAIGQCVPIIAGSYAGHTATVKSTPYDAYGEAAVNVQLHKGTPASVLVRNLAPVEAK